MQLQLVFIRKHISIYIHSEPTGVSIPFSYCLLGYATLDEHTITTFRLKLYIYIYMYAGKIKHFPSTGNGKEPNSPGLQLPQFSLTFKHLLSVYVQVI
jgi:hypothetical protein